MCHFSAKLDNFDFFGPNLPKNEFRVGNSENEFWNKNQHRQDAMRANFQEKRTILTFLTQILGLEFQKSKSGFGICTSKIPCVPILS